jgi:hypothetical protein
MAISINWLTKVISIPQSYLTFVSGIRYTLDIEKLRNDLKNLEDSEEGLPYPDTHARNKPVTLSGVVYAQTFEVLSPYTVTFENTGTPYVVVAEGANHNIGDVTNFDGGMSLVVGNSGGLIVNTINIGGGVGTVAEVADAVWNAVAASFNTAGTTGNKLNSAGSAGDPWNTDLTTYNTANTAGKYIKDTFGAASNIAVGSSSINSPASAFQLVQGTVNSGTFSDTRTVDVGQHVIYDNAMAFDINYTFNVGLNSLPSSVYISCAVNDQHESIGVYAWKAIGSTWEKIGVLEGQQSSTTFPTNIFTLYPDHVDTLGDVKIRFYQTALSDIHLHIDQLFVSHANIVSETDIAEAVRTELTPELTHIMLQENGLTATQATMLTEIYALYGLDPTKPLIVTDTNRQAGSGIQQTINSGTSITTVTRVV